MIILFNGSYCSELTVYPKNWNTKAASLQCTWYISYRFYDPATEKKCKQVILKRVNKFSDLADRVNRTYLDFHSFYNEELWKNVLRRQLKASSFMRRIVRQELNAGVYSDAFRRYIKEVLEENEEV